MAINDLIKTLGLGLILSCSGASDENISGCKHDSECKGNRICIDGECVEGSRTSGKDTYSNIPDTSQNCTSHAKKVCSDGDLYWKDSCGNLENKIDNCDYGCSSGKCNEPGKDTTSWNDTSGPSCDDECSNYGQTKCSGNGWKECGDYDSDSCLEWSDANECSGGKVCQDGECISTGCSSSEYTCNDGSCIPEGYVCDGGADCSDGEDEEGCCTNECISIDHKCEGTWAYKGCVLSEAGCAEWSSTVDFCPSDHFCNEIGNCAPFTFYCIPGSSFGPLGLEYVCDGEPVCEMIMGGESDEEGCPSSPYNCMEFNNCASQCSSETGFGNCELKCWAAASEEARQIMMEYDYCITQECGFDVSDVCQQQADEGPCSNLIVKCMNDN